MGNAVTGFFVTFSLIAGVVGVASSIAGFDYIRSWNPDSRPAATSAAVIAWGLTLLSMGYSTPHYNDFYSKINMIFVLFLNIIISFTKKLKYGTRKS